MNILMDGVYMMVSAVFNKEPSAQRTDESAHQSLVNRVCGGAKYLVMNKQGAQTSSQFITERCIKWLGEGKPVPTCCGSLRQGVASDLNESIKLLAKEVRKGNFLNYKQDKEAYRHAVDHLLHVLSQATRDDIASRSPESSFTGNLLVNSRYQPLHNLLENKCPTRASALSESLSDIREFVYFLDLEDQEKIYNELIKKY
ncbi:hypothetical protein [Endozoicomonas sp.]|uniref:hypothetical protein n=1 Tax=Endozoicomonas sp. TaxID=1892382 RepID=UPI00383AB6E9